MEETGATVLEKVELIRNRMDVTYKEAKEALDRATGDVVSALIMLEEEKKGTACIEALKTLCEKGAAAKIRLKKDKATLIEIPASAGVIGALGMLVSGELAVLGAVGTVTALLNKCTLEISGDDNSDSPGEDTGEHEVQLEVQLDP